MIQNQNVHEDNDQVTRLLIQLRKSVLCGTAVKERLAILYNLAKASESKNEWERDIFEHEAIRLDEIEMELSEEVSQKLKDFLFVKEQELLEKEREQIEIYRKAIEDNKNNVDYLQRALGVIDRTQWMDKQAAESLREYLKDTLEKAWESNRHEHELRKQKQVQENIASIAEVEARKNQRNLWKNGEE